MSDEFFKGSQRIQELYELYVNRIMKHYDLVWEQFKIYFGFTAGLVVVLGFVMKPVLEGAPFAVHPLIALALLVVSCIGVFTGAAWRTVARDGERWQRLMNECLWDVEVQLLTRPEIGLYHRILEEDRRTRDRGSDVIDVNVRIAGFFVIVWWGAVVFSAGLLIASVVQALRAH